MRVLKVTLIYRLPVRWHLPLTFFLIGIIFNYFFCILEILDELTDLSHTFSTHPTGKSMSTDVQQPPAAPVRKSITNEEIAIVDDNKIRINIYTDI